MSHNCENEHHHEHDGHDHVAPIPTNANQSLFSVIDTPKVRCLNVEPSNSSEGALDGFFLKRQDNRFNCGKFLQSDADCQVTLHIPFTANCKIFSVILRTNANDVEYGLNTPKTVKLYKNFSKNIDFDTLNSTKEDYKVQQPENVGILFDPTVEVNDDENTFVEHYLPRRLFQNCHSLTLFFEDNWADDEDELSRVYYLEIRGEVTSALQMNDGIPLSTVYESAPNPVDHSKLEAERTSANLNF